MRYTTIYILALSLGCIFVGCSNPVPAPKVENGPTPEVSSTPVSALAANRTWLGIVSNNGGN